MGLAQILCFEGSTWPLEEQILHVALSINTTDPSYTEYADFLHFLLESWTRTVLIFILESSF